MRTSPDVEALGGPGGHSERDPLVGADQALALVEVAGPDHHLALRVEEESGAGALGAGEQGLEDAAVGHGAPTWAAP